MEFLPSYSDNAFENDVEVEDETNNFISSILKNCEIESETIVESCLTPTTDLASSVLTANELEQLLCDYEDENQLTKACIDKILHTPELEDNIREEMKREDRKTRLPKDNPAVNSDFRHKLVKIRKEEKDHRRRQVVEEKRKQKELENSLRKEQIELKKRVREQEQLEERKMSKLLSDYKKEIEGLKKRFRKEAASKIVPQEEQKAKEKEPLPQPETPTPLPTPETSTAPEINYTEILQTHINRKKLSSSFRIWRNKLSFLHEKLHNAVAYNAFTTLSLLFRNWRDVTSSLKQHKNAHLFREQLKQRASNQNQAEQFSSRRQLLAFFSFWRRKTIYLQQKRIEHKQQRLVGQKLQNRWENARSAKSITSNGKQKGRSGKAPTPENSSEPAAQTPSAILNAKLSELRKEAKTIGIEIAINPKDLRNLSLNTDLKIFEKGTNFVPKPAKLPQPPKSPRIIPKTPECVNRMRKRAENQERKHAERRERLKKLEVEKIERMIQEESEKKRIEEEQVKEARRKRIEEFKEKKRKAKLREEKRQELKRKQEMADKVSEHS